MGWKWFGTETAAGLETRDGHCCPLWNQPEGGINLHILLASFCFRLKFPLWIFNPPQGWRQYTEKCQYTLRLKLNILSADQAVGENLLKEIQILFFLHSLIFCSLYKFWQFNLVGWGRIFAWKRVPSPKVSALKAFYKPDLHFFFCKAFDAVFSCPSYTAKHDCSDCVDFALWAFRGWGILSSEMSQMNGNCFQINGNGPIISECVLQTCSWQTTALYCARP